MQIGSEMAALQEKTPKMDPKKRFFWKIPQDFELLKKVPQNIHQTGQFGWNRYIGTWNLSHGAFLTDVIYCRSHSIYDLRYDREAFSYIGCLDNHTWQFFAICCRIFMSSRLFPLVLRTKELLHWSVLPWPWRGTLRACAYFPIGVPFNSVI